eukprot:scaffold256_cov261-Pinguiococcus_pyrenoidosus.AAC.47
MTGQNACSSSAKGPESRVAFGCSPETRMTDVLCLASAMGSQLISSKIPMGLRGADERERPPKEREGGGGET